MYRERERHEKDLYCTFRLLEHGDPAEQPVAAETPAALLLLLYD